MILQNVETNLSYMVENPKDFHMSNTHHENLETNNKFIPFHHLPSFFRGTIYEIRPEITSYVAVSQLVVTINSWLYTERKKETSRQWVSLQYPWNPQEEPCS